MNNMEKTENINQMTENTLFMIQNNLFMSLMRGLMSRTYSHWSQRLKNHNIRTWRTWSWVRSRWENIKWNVEPWIEMDEMEMVWNGEKIGKITIFLTPRPDPAPLPPLRRGRGGGGGGGVPPILLSYFGQQDFLPGGGAIPLRQFWLIFSMEIWFLDTQNTFYVCYTIIWPFFLRE